MRDRRRRRVKQGGADFAVRTDQEAGLTRRRTNDAAASGASAGVVNEQKTLTLN
jgi:hypothetical protein